MSIRGVFLNPGTGALGGTTLTYTGNFAGITDSPTGTLSFWWRSLSPTVFDTTSTGFMQLLFTYPESPSAFFTFMNDAAITPGFETSFTDGTVTNKSSLGPGRVWVQDGNWHHIILAWDMNHAIGSRVYNCAIDRLVSWPVNTSGGQAGGAFSIPYSAVTTWQINHGNLTGGDIAELWFAPGVQLDVTDTAVLDKFATTGGVPVGLGSDGSTPTGTAPILYLSVQSSTASDILANRGSGGGAFVVDAISEIGLALSGTDPAFDVPRRITGSRSTLTMRTASFSGLDVSQAFPSSGFVYFGETSTGLLNGASLAIATAQPQFDSGDLITPVTASFASLHDDAVNYDSAAITPPVAGDGDGIGTFLMAKGTGSVYLWQVDKSTPAVSVDVFPLTTSITTIGPITVPITAWMTDQFTNLAHPQQMASLLWWDGKEQCAGLADSTPASGNVAMVDSAGTITDTKVWGGYTEWQDWLCRNGGSAGNVLLTIPDAVNNQNYFIIGQTNGPLQYNTVYGVTADSTGTELSRAPIYCDDLDVESIVRFSVNFPVSGLDITGFAATPQGFAYLASDGDTTYLLMLDREATTYTLYTIEADPADATAMTLLGTFGYSLSSAYVDSQHWLLLQDGSSTAILWDGSDEPPGVSITGVSASALVSAPVVEIDRALSGATATVAVGGLALSIDSNVSLPGISMFVSVGAPRTLVADLVSPPPAGIDAPLFSPDDFTQAYLDLLPHGRVWPKYRGSNLRDTVAALIGSYARVPASLIGSDASAYGSTHRAVDELLDTMPYWDRLGPNAVTDLLPEWQSTLGLPDDCLGDDPSIAQQIAQCVARFILLGGQSIAFFTRAAADLGFSISVTEYVGFRPDIDTSDYELRDEWAVFLWLITSIDDGSWLFETDVNTGDEALGGFGNTTLQCELLEIAPAHTVPYFAVVPDLPIHGVVAMVEVGTVGTETHAEDSITGVEADVLVGTVTTTGDSNVSLIGVEADVQVGITTTSGGVTLTGVEAGGEVGAVTI